MASDLHSSTSSHMRLVGLLDCYHGGNFGDGAVQDAIISNLVGRICACSINLITLAPDRTTEIHGVPSHPLTTEAFKLTRDRPDAGTDQAPSSSVTSNPSFRERLRRSPVANLLRIPWRVIWRAFIFARTLIDELRHILAVRRLLRGFHLLIVSGGGQLDDYWGGPMGHPYNLLKWSLLAKISKVPVVFLSVGVDRLEHNLSRHFVRIALKLATYRSYRDAGSKSMLADMPFTHPDPVTPDLAYSFNPGIQIPGAAPADNQRLPRVGISPMAYQLKDHWPQNDANIFEPYFDTLVDFTAELLKRGHEVFLFATAGADNFVTTMMMERLEHMLPPDQRAGLRRIAVPRVQALMAELAAVELILASRLHGVILAHVIQKPVVAISYDRKVTRYMQDVDQSDYCLDIHNLRAADLKKVFADLSAKTSVIRALLVEKAIDFRRLLSHQYDCVASLPGHGLLRNGGCD